VEETTFHCFQAAVGESGFARKKAKRKGRCKDGKDREKAATRVRSAITLPRYIAADTQLINIKVNCRLHVSALGKSPPKIPKINMTVILGGFPPCSWRKCAACLVAGTG